MQAIRAELQGIETTLRKLENVKRSVANKILRKAVGEADKLFLAAMKGFVAVGATGMLKKSLGRKEKTYREANVTVGLVGPRTGFTSARDKTTGRRQRVATALGKKFKSLGVNPILYAHLVEKGTRPHSLGAGSSIRKNVQNAGRMHPGAKAKPFEQPAYESQKSAAEETVRRIVEVGIEEAASQ